MELRDEIAELLIQSIPESKPLAELIHGGLELDLTVVNSIIDLVPADLVAANSMIIDAYGIVTEQLAGGTEDQGIVTIYEDAASPISLSTIEFANAGADAIGDIRLRTALASGGAANPAAGNKKYYAKVTTACTGTSAAGKVKVYLRWIRGG